MGYRDFYRRIGPHQGERRCARDLLGPSHQASSAAAQARAGCGGQSSCRDLATDHGLYMTLKKTQSSVTGNGLTGREDGDLDQINGKWGHEVRRQIHNGCSRLRAQDTYWKALMGIGRVLGHFRTKTVPAHPDPDHAPLTKDHRGPGGPAAASRHPETRGDCL